MADAPPAASGQRSVTLDIGAIGSGLGDGIDIEEALKLKHAYNKGRPYRHGGKKC